MDVDTRRPGGRCRVGCASSCNHDQSDRSTQGQGKAMKIAAVFDLRELRTEADGPEPGGEQRARKSRSCRQAEGRPQRGCHDRRLVRRRERRERAGVPVCRLQVIPARDSTIPNCACDARGYAAHVGRTTHRFWCTQPSGSVRWTGSTTSRSRTRRRRPAAGWRPFRLLLSGRSADMTSRLLLSTRPNRWSRLRRKTPPPHRAEIP